jgi:large subunit ribosomal protein L4
MATNEVLNFSVKSLSGPTQDQASLSLKVPEYCGSKDLADKSNYLVHRAFQTQVYNERQGTRSTKTRAEVRGGGRKPWQQKGSGRARAGSNRSPLWKGGGVSFGPKPKLYCNKINRKEWRLSLRILLLKKQKNIIVVDRFEVPSFKTKDFVQSLKNLGSNASIKTVLVAPKMDESLQRSSKNLKNVRLLQANCLNIRELLTAKSIILTKESLKIIEETYKNG